MKFINISHCFNYRGLNGVRNDDFLMLYINNYTLNDV